MGRLEEEQKIRLDKLNKIQKSGRNPFPARTKRSHEIQQVIIDFGQIQKSGLAITLAGRIRTIRLHGGSCFCHIEDGSGKFQIYLKKDKIGEKLYNEYKSDIDIGDFIEITGSLFTTKRGEKTLLATNFILLSKSLLPLPEKWHGLTDTEIRYRKRYLDLISNEQIKKIFKKRSALIKSIRTILDNEGFIEVDTPILQSIPGGANAKPFKTHHNTLNTDLYLRIAPELYLKRLIIGGFEKVYEIARCFRNEGIDRDHNPEFTQVEFYAAYWDYQKMMKFTEKMISDIALTVNKQLTLKYGNNEIDFNPPYEKITFVKAIKKYANIDIDKKDEKELIRITKKIKLKIDKSFNKAKILDEIFKELVRPNLIKPTFITEHPIELSPLAKKLENSPEYVERFQLLVAGTELCNAFSEINDPIDQKERFLMQERMRKSGDDEAQRIDTDFIEALSYGMPPTAGIGIGIDRLAAILADTHNIKEVILFPTLKPKK